MTHRLLPRPGDLFAQALPDLPVRLDERRGQPDLLDVARPGQRHVEDRLDRGRAGRHDDDPVGERDRLLEVVRHEHHRGPGALPEPQQLVLHQRPGLHVQRAERLVHQHDLRLVDQRLGQRDPLAHAAGELVWVVLRERAQPDPLDPDHGAFAGLVLGDAAVARPGGDVVEDRTPRQHGVGLEHVADAGRNSPDRRTVDVDLAAGRRLEAGDEGQGGGFAAAGRPDHGDELAGVDGEGQVPDRGVWRTTGARESLGGVPQRDYAHGALLVN
jgi:hypothetical protein